MSLLQVNVDDNLKRAIEKKADSYGIPTSTLVRIVLVKSFLENRNEDNAVGNIFNADRDNNGKGLKIDDFIAAL
jgi:hypothetical protein